MPSGRDFWYDHLPQLGSFLLAPIGGFVVAFVFRTEECNTIPGGTIGGVEYGSRDVCSTALNDEAGVIVGLIVLALAGVWLGLTILAEQGSG